MCETCTPDRVYIPALRMRLDTESVLNKHMVNGWPKSTACARVCVCVINRAQGLHRARSNKHPLKIGDGGFNSSTILFCSTSFPFVSGWGCKRPEGECGRAWLGGGGDQCALVLGKGEGTGQGAELSHGENKAHIEKEREMPRCE